MKQRYEKFFAYQLEKPTGLFGRFLMKRFLNKGNQRSNELALKHILETAPLESVLEIGFGGGWLLEALLKASDRAKLVGLDHSTAMVAAARRRFNKLSDRVRIECGRAERLPFPAESFSHVCTVHTAYFWEEPVQVIREMQRVLQPNGILVLGIHSKAKLETQTVTQFNFTFYEPQALVELLAAQGFESIALHSYDPDEWEDNHCIVARKAGTAR
jgi:ubiquinone/menaquinone biosynthesis C-methylase UbiE